MAFLRRGSREGVSKRDFADSMALANDDARPSFCAAASGYLDKKAKSPPYRWQRRYFVASGHYLRYYDSDASRGRAAVRASRAFDESRRRRGRRADRRLSRTCLRRIAATLLP